MNSHVRTNVGASGFIAERDQECMGVIGPKYVEPRRYCKLFARGNVLPQKMESRTFW
jgi:hypothetical protein